MQKNGKKKGQKMTVVPEEASQINVLRNAFVYGTKLKALDIDMKGSIKAVSSELEKQPLNSMELLPYSDGQPDPVQKTSKNPKNIVSGVGYGTWAFVKGIGTGLSGVVTEPYHGAKDSGIKGATIGVGKGIMGLVIKPCMGTFGFV